MIINNSSNDWRRFDDASGLLLSKADECDDDDDDDDEISEALRSCPRERIISRPGSKSS